MTPTPNRHSAVILTALVGNEWRRIECRYFEAVRQLHKWRGENGRLRGWTIELKK